MHTTVRAVLPPAEDGAWDDGRRFVDCVIEVDGTYHLYYHGQAEGLPILNYYDIGHATSSDGITWELDPANPVLTRGADGDVNFLRWGNSGGLPVIVLAPVNAADCFTLTVQAFNLAEKFRCPVFLASNKEIAMTR